MNVGVPSNASELEPYLQAVIRRNVTLQEDEVKLANQNLQRVLLQSMECKMKEDETFRALYKEPRYVGSYYENLRVGHPEEFDINLEMELPVRPEFIQIVTTSTVAGFAKIKINGAFKPSTSENVSRKITRWLDGNGFLKRATVIQWMQGVVDTAIYNVQWPSNMQVTRSMSGPAVTLHVIQNGIAFDVDLVPVFRFGREKWPQRPLRQADNLPRRDITTDHLKWCVVPKAPRNAPPPDNQWRMSFYMFEKEFMSGLYAMKPIIKLFKLLRDRQGWVDLSSYYIKTLFMWEYEKQAHNPLFWRNGLGYLFMHMLSVLEQSLLEGKIPFFWQNGSNLLGHLNPACIVNWAGRVNYLKKLINRALSTRDIPVSVAIETIFTTRSSSGLNLTPSPSQEQNTQAYQTQREPLRRSAIADISSLSLSPSREENTQGYQPQSEPLSWGAIAGISVGIAALGALVIGVAANRNRNNN